MKEQEPKDSEKSKLNINHEDNDDAHKKPLKPSNEEDKKMEISKEDNKAQSGSTMEIETVLNMMIVNSL